ncbi:MAG: ABC transporter ATP-binding protein [Lachnospiraceae bacterium]|uniref:ABC transporter ATP-binding protein n=1 Tax=Candidatus Weimeria bifida TaxID=2599074 RepID=A0A6N7IX54_9FIRM|nr:ABC transporter ATP-binding protein [Candidatus Weimeria bifida]RRF97212.1 MAG: ABC transporter ATP-binding protein [Lachnospiraceae bacterium]
MLEFKNLVIGYNNTPLVNIPDMTVEGGEILSVAGPNGCGKSTLLKTITCSLPAVSGDIFLDTKNGRRESLKSIGRETAAKNISALFTDRIKGNGLRCSDIVAAGRYPYTGFFGKLSEHDNDMIRQSMELTNTAELAGRQFDALSDGQKQRVLLARSICQDPEVLILDEPTAFLDIRYQYELKKILLKLRESGIAIIMSIHELSLARECSDKIIAINEEHQAAIDMPEALDDEKYIHKLFGIRD